MKIDTPVYVKGKMYGINVIGKGYLVSCLLIACIPEIHHDEKFMNVQSMVEGRELSFTS